jgi:hypothetical protein
LWEVLNHQYYQQVHEILLAKDLYEISSVDEELVWAPNYFLYEQEYYLHTSESDLDLGIHRIGFVALMPVNDFCKEHFVDINDIPFS